MKECKLSGFRFDAIQHFSQHFTNRFVAHLDEKFGKNTLFYVGEFWTGDAKSLCGYLEDMEHKFCLFDAPLLYNFSRISTEEKGDLRGVFEETLVKAEPYNAVVGVVSDEQ